MIQIAIFDIDGLFLGTTTLEFDQFNLLRDNTSKLVELKVEGELDNPYYKMAKLFNSFILIQIPKEKEYYDKDTKKNLN